MKVKRQMYYQGHVYGSIGNRIVVQKPGSEEWEPYLILDDLTVLNYLELYNRLFRHGIHNFYKIDQHIDCIVIKGRILFFKNRRLINMVTLKHGHRPLRQGIVYAADHIIYSEYYGNSERQPIHIYKYDFINNERKIIYTFDDIRHIHFIQKSIKKPHTLLIGTGDLDPECGIYRFDLGTGRMSKLGGGSQTWRAVSLLEIGDYLVWGTDDPTNQNYLVRFNLQNGKFEELHKIDGPAYYSAVTKNKEYFVATTVEDKNRHRANIYRSRDGERWKGYREFKKDIFHTKYFGYGVIEFINNQIESEKLLYSVKGLA